MATVTDLVHGDDRILDYREGRYLVELELDRRQQQVWVRRCQVDWDRPGQGGLSVLDRMIMRLDSTPWGCLVWNHVLARGYGCLTVPLRTGNGHLKLTSQLVHRLAWSFETGWEIPKGLEINHWCHSGNDCTRTEDCPHRRCAEYTHLELVTCHFHHTLTHRAN